jgi:hypothetical protein
MLNRFLLFLSLISKSQPEDSTLLIELQRLQLGGSDSSGSDSGDSDSENSKDVKPNMDSEVKEAEETIDRSVRFPGHLSASM